MYEQERDPMQQENNTTGNLPENNRQPEAASYRVTPAEDTVANNNMSAGYHSANSYTTGQPTGNTTDYTTGNTNPTGYTTGSATGHTTSTPTGGQPTNNSAQPGYSYVNYYSNPNAPTQVSGSSGMSPKKKNHFWMKAVAFVAAMVVVSAASIGISNSLQNKNNNLVSTNESSQSTTVSPDDSSLNSDDGETADADATDSDAAATANDTNSNNSVAAESWIELAAGSDAMSVSDIIKKVTPSVVGVQATFQMQNTYNNYSYGYGYGYGMFGDNSNNNSSSTMTGVGTGIIMREDGYIVTNAHVIYDSDYGCGEATAVEIRMSDEETTYDAQIVAYDVESDIAVLKVDQTGLTAAEFGNSDDCEVGDMVVAIGNPLGLELQNTATCGIISAMNRQVTINDKTMTLIQTDTAINSGNSGGPLINSAGQVIGINSAKMSSSVSSDSATVEGIGFAIPMTEAQEIVNDLINYGYVTGRPQLGITCQDVSEAVAQAYNMPIGAYIISVTEGGAADEAGLQAGDIITAINDNEISTTEELNNYKNEFDAGDTVTLTIVRNGQEQRVDVVLKEVTQNQQS